MSERWSTAEVVLSGPEFRWSLGLQQYEFPADATGYDGNWIEAEVDLQVETVGRFSARRRVSIETTELARFADALQVLLRTRSGEASFEPLEEETGLTIRSVDGGDHDFEAEIFVLSHSSPELRARELATATRNLQELAHTLREAQRAFPIRGNPHA